MIELLHKAVAEESGSEKFSLEVNGEITLESFKINWADNDVEEPSKENVFQAYQALVLEKQSPLNAIKKAYRAHTSKGIEYFEDVRAKLVLKYTAGQISAQDCAHIENKLDPVKSKVVTGDWLSASFAIQSTTTDAVYTDDLKTDITNYIQNYINVNY